MTSTVSPRGTAWFANPAAYTTSYAYDGAGRLTRLTDPMGGVTVRRYDRNGNLDLVTDADNKTTTYDHDAADQPTVVHRPDTTTLSTAYDLDGRVTHQVDGANAATLYAYDPLGRLASVTDPQGRTTTYSHDPAGNITTKQDPDGNCTATPKTGCTTFGYDAADQQTTIGYSEGATPNVTIGYDTLGQRTSMTDGTGTSTWTWDSLGRLVASSTGSGLTGGAQTVGYAYDLRNSKTSTTYPGNKTVPRVYDAAGNLTSTTDWTGTASTFAYDADDNLIVRSAQGLDTTLAYDANSRVTAINVGYWLLFSTSTQSYGRTPTGQLTSTSGSGSMTESNNYTYTGLNQLKTANGANYTYDPADNLTRLGDGTTQTFSAANQLCWTAPTTTATACGTPPAGATTYGYDTRGNRTTRTPPTGPVATYGYDQANRLTTAPGATYRYRGDGLRLSKTVGTTTTTYTWDQTGALPLLLSETTNGATTRYIYGTNDKPIEQIGPNGILTYLHYDQIGSVRMLTQNATTVAATFTYDPYGKKTASTGTVTTPFGFAGQCTDTETGFQYLRARYYDPSTGNFLTRDPIVGVTRDAYGYADGDPLNIVDPSGLIGLSDLWQGVRSVATAPVSAAALAVNYWYSALPGRSVDCTWNARNMVSVCSGGPTILYAKATAFGGVINTRYSYDEFLEAEDCRLMAHETKHTDQWAIFGPIQFASLDTGAAVGDWISNKAFGTDIGTMNIFEVAAGLKDGGYVP